MSDIQETREVLLPGVGQYRRLGGRSLSALLGRLKYRLLWWLQEQVERLSLWVNQYAETLQGPESAAFWWLIWTLEDVLPRCWQWLDEQLMAAAAISSQRLVNDNLAQ